VKLSSKLVILFLLLTSCLTSLGQYSPCKEISLGSISFKPKSSKLTVNAKKQLDSLAKFINNSNNSCQLIATASYADRCDRCGGLAWDRTQAILSYLTKRGVANEKMAATSRLERNSNFIVLTLAQMTERNQLHPNFRRN